MEADNHKTWKAPMLTRSFLSTIDLFEKVCELMLYLVLGQIV